MRKVDSSLIQNLQPANSELDMAYITIQEISQPGTIPRSQDFVGLDILHHQLIPTLQVFFVIALAIFTLIGFFVFRGKFFFHGSDDHDDL